MKKLWFLTIITVLSFMVNSCGGEDDSTHSHSFGNWVIKSDATCTTALLQERNCSCGEIETQTVGSALGHNISNWLQKTAATCEDDKIEEGTCTRENCFETDTRSIADTAIGHNFLNFIWIELKTGVEVKNCGNNNCNENNNEIRLTLEIGETGPGGGKIFYRNEEGFVVQGFGNESDLNQFESFLAYYLEVAPNDMSVKLAITQDHAIDIIGTETTIGTGRRNTMLIIKGAYESWANAISPASIVCIEYSNNNKNDWFLPSKDEIEQLYFNRDVIDNFRTDWSFYWTSSQGSLDVAMWSLSSGDGSFAEFNTKTNEFFVRAIRAF